MIDKIRDAVNTNRGAACTLILIYFIAVLFTYFVVDSSAYGPVHFNDEVRYWETALDISDGTYRINEDYRFPPLYSLSLAPAFLLFSRYQAYAAAKMLDALYINSVIFPVYFLLRKFFSRAASVVVSALMLLLPVHLVIPRSMISENIYYPLLLWGLLFSFTNVLPLTRKNRLIEDGILGILLAMLMLTRFISLVIVPALLFIWWLKPFPFRNENKSRMISSEKIKHLLVVLMLLALIMGIWLLAGLAAGVSARHLLGLSVTADYDPAQLEYDRLLMWAVFYSCYVILLAGPALPVLLVSLAHFDFKKWREDFQRWWLALAILLAAFMAAVVRHSWKAWYNFPDPSRVQGRYILYFASLFILTAVIALKELAQKKIKILSVLLVTVISIGLMLASYSVLFDHWIYLDHPLGISVSSPFGYMLVTLDKEFLYLAGMLIVLIGIYLGTLNKKILALVAVLVCAFYVYGNVRFYRSMLLPRQNSNFQIAQIIRAIEKDDDLLEEFRSSHLVFTANPKISATKIKYWGYMLSFNGYQDFEFVQYKNEEATSLVLNLEFADVSIDLLKLSKDESFYPDDVIEFGRDTYIIEGLPD